MVIIFIFKLVAYLTQIKVCYCESKFSNFLISVDELKGVISQQTAALEQHQELEEKYTEALAEVEMLKANLTAALAEVEILKANLTAVYDRIQTLEATSFSHSSMLTTHVSTLYYA